MTDQTPELNDCCAHMRVRYRTVEQGSGCVSGHWECEDCFTEFTPMPYTSASATATAEPKVLEDAERPVIHHNMGERFTVLPETHSKHPVIDDGALAEALKWLEVEHHASWCGFHHGERCIYKCDEMVKKIRETLVNHAILAGVVEVTVDELLRDVGYRDNMFAEILTCIGQAYPEGVKIVDGGK